MKDQVKQDIKPLAKPEAAKKQGLREWRENRQHDLTLPSGLAVKVRNVDLADLLVSGKIPASIIGLVQNVVKEDDNVDLEKIGFGLLSDLGPDYEAMLDTIVTEALIEPRVGDKADEGCIMLAELGLSDKTAIMQFVNRSAEQIPPATPG